MGTGSIAAGFALFLATGALPVSAHAQTSTLEVPAAKKWKHAQTGLIVPQAPGGLPRTEITSEGQGELDIAVQFGDVNKTRATLYLFRPSLMSVPVWFDRVETQILLRSDYGNAVAADAPSGFVMPGGVTASALRRIYKPSKPPYSATGAAVLALGDWLVVVRISSVEQAPAQLDATMSALIAGLGWPAASAKILEAPAAVPVQPCATPLRYDAKAKMKKPDMAAGLLGATLAMMGSKQPKTEENAEEARPATFCRDGEPTKEFGVYRHTPGDTQDYVIALSDAGRTISVYPDLFSDAKKPGCAVTLSTLDQSFVYPTFDRLPEPAKVMQAIDKTQPISSTTRDSQTINIQTQ
ncbi:hypothetical protein [Sphingomonas trueperi]|uniref:hypothetical protein n=1 Tax=Sphingomonas trueperi TaxID=53317 RepID=UPI000EB3AC28